MQQFTSSSFVVGMRAGILLVALMAAGSGGLRGGAQEGTPIATPTGEPSCTVDLGMVRSSKTCINVVHASPDAPAVDVYLNGTLALAGLEFGTASGFAPVPGGTYQVQVTAAGAALDTAVIDVPALELVPARAYEIVAVGLLAEIEVAVFEADVFAVEGPATFGSSRLRVVHASPDAPAIDVTLIADDIATRPISGLAYPDASAYAVTAAGTYGVQVAVSEGGAELLFLAEVTFERDTVYSLYAIGLAGDGTLTVLPVATAASRLSAMSTPAAG